ncbi:MAG: AIR synthase family protein [Anaerovoracaceae bacterium]
MLKVGKLDSDVLQKIVIDNIDLKRPEVLTRAGIGEDCAVIDYGDYECAISTDPITAAVNEIGRLAIHISCNDIASNGIEPLGIALVVMLPVGTTVEDVEIIMKQAAAAARESGVEIIGGHTEVTPAVNQPVIVSTAFGRGKKGQSQSAKNMKVGDYILMTKTAGLEGTAIIASDNEKQLTQVLTREEIVFAKDLVKKVSVVKEGIIAGKIGTAGMHDITEGGVLGAVWEMCNIADLGAELWVEKIPVEVVTQKICKHFDIDYLRLISSGSMLIVASKEQKDEILSKFATESINVACIGQIATKERGIVTINNGVEVTVAPPRMDELYKVAKPI